MPVEYGEIFPERIIRYTRYPRCDIHGTAALVFVTAAGTGLVTMAPLFSGGADVLDVLAGLGAEADGSP
jgi:hypothetical protein